MLLTQSFQTSTQGVEDVEDWLYYKEICSSL